MGILIKFTIKNIKEKKFRLFLILLSISLSSALLFASTSISDTMGNIYLEQYKKYFGTSEIMIYAGQKSESSVFRVNDFLKYKDKMEYVVSRISRLSKYINKDKLDVTFDLQGYELQELNMMNPFSIQEEKNLLPFKGQKIILGRADAEKYNLKVGHNVNLNIGEDKHSFVLSAIVDSTGLFRPTERNVSVVVPKDTLAKICNARGKVNTLFMKTKEGTDVSTFIESIRDNHPKYYIRETISKEEIKRNVAPISTMFMLMLVLVVFISIFIIYTSFKVITLERLPLIGTFRSVGATKKMTDIILISESVIYGFLGGTIGVFLGIGILTIMTTVLAQDPYSGGTLNVSISFGIRNILGAFLLAVGLSIISSLVPIIKVSNIPVKDIVLNNIDKQNKKGVLKYVIGIALIALSLTVPCIVQGSMALMIDAICMLGGAVGIVFLIPLVMKFFVFILERIFKVIFGNEGILAIKNLRDNKNVYNNVALLTIGIASLLMINTISYSVNIEVLDVYSDAKYDIGTYIYQTDRNRLQIIKNIKGVSDVFGVYVDRNIEIKGKNGRIRRVYGINPHKYLDYWDIDFIGKKEELMKQLDDGRNIIINRSVMEKFDLKVGDIVYLNINEKDRPYKIIGETNTLMNNGNIAYVSEGNLKRDSMITYMNDIYIKTSIDPNIVKENIRKKFGKGIWIETMEDMKEKNMKSNQQIFILLQGFSILTMVIGIFGVLNNYIISIMSRKRDLAMFRSVGMGKKQMIKMLFIESFSGGIVGGITGIAGGLLLLELTGFILKAMNLPVAIHYSPVLLIESLFGGICIAILASISPVIKNSKLNIIEAIKYE